MAYQFTKEDARKGGIKSGESRRNKRTLRETTETLLRSELPPKMRQELADRGFPAETYMDALAVAVIESAQKGNAQQFSNLMKLLGEDVQKVSIAPSDESIREMEAYMADFQERYAEEQKAKKEQHFGQH